jgi:hypothetical protein
MPRSISIGSGVSFRLGSTLSIASRVQWHDAWRNRSGSRVDALERVLVTGSSSGIEPNGAKAFYVSLARRLKRSPLSRRQASPVQRDHASHRSWALLERSPLDLASRPVLMGSRNLQKAWVAAFDIARRRPPSPTARDRREPPIGLTQARSARVVRPRNTARRNGRTRWHHPDARDRARHGDAILQNFLGSGPSSVIINGHSAIAPASASTNASASASTNASASIRTSEDAASTGIDPAAPPA